MVFFTQYFKDYLLGRKFYIVTDHRALVWLYSFKEPDGLVARWLEKLSVFDFEINHRPGTKIAHADALSRIPSSTPIVSSIEVVKPYEPFETIQTKDVILSEVRNWVRLAQRPPREELFGQPTLLVNYWHQFESLCLEGNLLYRRYESIDGSLSVLQLCVPLVEVPNILKQLHGDPSGGHLGAAKTLYRVKQKFYWPGSRNDVENWVASCVECQTRKNPKQKHRRPMTLWPSSEPFYHVSVDIMGPLPVSKGYKYILMIGDNFSRWFEAVPLVDITAQGVCLAFLEHWVSRYGVPEFLHSDNGVQFTSHLFRDMCTYLGITRTRSTPYHPQGNAKVERINRTIEDGLAKYCSDYHETWVDHLQSFMMAYRSAVHESIGHTPYKVLMGNDMRLPIDLMYPTATHTNDHSYQSLVHVRLNNYSSLFQFVRAKCNYEHRRQKVYFDKKIYGPTFSKGDLILLHSPVLKPGQVSKFKSHWSGPYIITRKINDLNFLVSHCSTGKVQIVHYDRIKPHIQRHDYIGRHKTNKLSPKKPVKPKDPSDSDNDLLYLEVESDPSTVISPAATNNTVQTIPNTRSLTAAAATSAQNSSSRPERIASKAAKRPGFYYIP